MEKTIEEMKKEISKKCKKYGERMIYFHDEEKYPPVPSNNAVGNNFSVLNIVTPHCFVESNFHGSYDNLYEYHLKNVREFIDNCVTFSKSKKRYVCDTMKERLINNKPMERSLNIVYNTESHLFSNRKYCMMRSALFEFGNKLFKDLSDFNPKLMKDIKDEYIKYINPERIINEIRAYYDSEFTSISNPKLSEFDEWIDYTYNMIYSQNNDSFATKSFMPEDIFINNNSRIMRIYDYIHSIMVQLCFGKIDSNSLNEIMMIVTDNVMKLKDLFIQIIYQQFADCLYMDKKQFVLFIRDLKYISECKERYTL